MSDAETYRDKISLKLLKASLVVAFTTGILLGASQLLNDYSMTFGELDQTVERVLQVAQRSAAQAVYTLDPELAGEVVKGVMEYGFIVSGRITDEWGDDLASKTSAVSGSRTRWITRLLTEEYDEVNTELLLPDGTRTIGHMAVTVDRDAALKPFFKRAVFAIVSGLLVMLVLTFALFGTFYVLITRPLVRLADGLGHLDPEEPEKGNLEPLAGHRSDELGLVVNTLNRFLESSGQHLRERRRAEEELRAARNTLEIRVEERTRELQEAMEAAQSADRAKGEFLARMSHEIRTPLNAIVGMSHLALQTRLTNKQKDYIGKIDSSARSLVRIVEDVLDFSRIEADQFELEVRPFALEGVLKYLADIMSMKANEKGLEFLYQIAGDVPNHLTGDEVRLGQVLVNLAGNAIKFTEKGEVVLSVGLLGEEGDRVTLEFSITDTGIGISPGQVKDLFNPFTQADGYYTRRYGGTGLGLAICQRIVRMMDGDIEVQSDPGVGSTFTFTAEFKRDTGQEDLQLRFPPELTGMKVLVVDESETSRRIIREILESFTFDVVLAATEQDGLAELDRPGRGRPFDLVIASADPPGGAGRKLREKTRGQTRLSGSPKVLLLTGPGVEDAGGNREDSYPDGYIEKPVTPSGLFDAVMSTFRFGITDGDAVLPADPGKKEALDGIKGARVLLVEDNEINQQVATELLRRAGLVVTLACNGREGVESFEASGDPGFDLVLMDIQMPEMDGIEATAAIRDSDSPGAKEVPIVAMTAHALKGDRKRSLRAGMNDYVTKPIDPEKFYTVLVKWIEAGEREAVPDETGIAGFDRDAPDIPALDGINVTLGLSRLGGNKKLYQDLLVRFYQNHGSAADQIREALERDDRETATRIAHTIKGVSGNLGAEGIQEAATTLESHLRRGQEDPGESISVFEEEIKRLWRPLGEYVSSVQEGEAAKSQLLEAGETAMLGELLRELEPFVEGRKPKGCRNVMDRILRYSWPDGYARELENLDKLVSRYRYREAGKVLLALDEKINQEETRGG